MKNSVLVFSAIAFSALSANAAHGAQANCSGEYLGFSFLVKAPISGSRVAGKVKIAISGNGGFRKDGVFTATSSDIRVGKSIQFAANSANGTSGSLKATYDPNVGMYVGTLQAQGSLGSVEVPVNCSKLNATSAPHIQMFTEEVFPGTDGLTSVIED